jgi:hypothetical protein
MKRIVAFIIAFSGGAMLYCQPECRRAAELKSFRVEEAKQGVAVDRHCFYVINSSTITKHDKETGELLNSWDGSVIGVKHLNSGVVTKGKLYCATSNYPDTPMAGSIEIFDARTLKHTGSHSFGIFKGSATWIDKRDGCWYVGFAHYTGNGSSEGKDTRWTTVVRFDRKWRETGSWIFPDNIIKLFSPMSNSGATWGSDGRLYCTGHDEPEIYVMEIPRTGYTLNHVGTIATPAHGQGIAIDRTVNKKLIMYGIQRDKNLVVAFEIQQDND